MPQPRRRAAEMFPLIESYLSSGQTQKAFCHDHDLTEAVLNYWISKYRREKEHSSAFVQVSPEPFDAAFLELVYPSGVHVRFFSAVPAAYLSELVHCRI